MSHPISHSGVGNHLRKGSQPIATALVVSSKVVWFIKGKVEQPCESSTNDSEVGDIMFRP